MSRFARSCTLLLFALSLFGCGGTSEAPGEGAIEGAIALPEEGSPFIAFDIWVKAGSQDDPAGKEGLAALTANLLSDSGTRENSYQQILEKLYPMASSYFSSTDKEMTVFRGVVHRDNLDQYYELFKQAILAPGFDEEDFNRVKSQTLNFLERGRRFQRDEELSKELLFWMAYRGTPYEHPEEGYVKSAQSISLDDVKGFYASRYAANNIVVGVGGGYPEGFVERVRADFDSLPTVEVAQTPPPDPAMPDGVKVLIVEKETDSTAISFGYPHRVLRGDPDYSALNLTGTWLGEHRSSVSHLYQVIRDRRGMNYGDYAYVEAFPRGFTTQERPVNYARRSQLFEVWIRPISETAPGNLHDRSLFATRAGWREVAKLAADGLPPSEVDRTRNYLHNYSVTYGSTIGRRLAFAVDDAFYGLESPGYLGTIRPGLAELDADSVNEVIRRHVQAENMYLVLITRDAEGMKRKLLSGEPTGITYAGEQPTEILEEDVEIASFPIPVEEDDIMVMDIMEVFEGQ